MKVLKFLKSRVGAVSKAGALGVGLTVGLVGLNVYNYVNERPAAQEQEIRSLSAIMASGGTLPAEYSGINVSRGANEFASAEERAARDGSLFDGGEGAVAALGGIDGITVRGSALGQGEAGLGMGANAAEQLGAAGKQMTGNVNADGSAVGAAAAEKAGKTQINQLGDSKEGDLKRASVARASGSNLGSGGAVAGQSARGAARTEAQSRTGASSISGMMPEGTTLVASNNALRGAASSSFRPGNVQSRVGTGINSREGNSLRSIAVGSSKVAANRNRSDNEGAQVFMGGEKLSGGINVVGETANTAASSAEDFEEDMNAREKGAAQAIDEIDTTEQERKDHRSRLVKNMFMLMLATLAAGFAINKLMKSPEWWSKLIAAVIGAAMLVTIGLFIADAAKYISKYGGDGWSVTSVIMGILMVGAIAVSFFNFSGAESSKVTEAAAQGTGGGTAAAAGAAEGAGAAGSSFGSSLVQGLQGMGVSQGLQTGADYLMNGQSGSSSGSGEKGK